MANNAFFNHSGDSFTDIPRISKPQKRGQASVFSMIT